MKSPLGAAVASSRRRYIAAFDFEESGQPAGTAKVGTPDFDYATAPLVGAQSLRIPAGSSWQHGMTKGIGSRSEVWMFLRFKREGSANGNQYAIELGASGSPPSSQYFYITSDGGTALKLYCGSVTAATVTLANGVSYALWIRFKAGSGSNAIGQVWVSTNETRPESPSISITNGTITQNRTYAAFWSLPNTACVLDKIRIGDFAIGSNPL